ncbi:MAG TPA: hypothetical protein VFS32_12905 [Candidatus Limnocylindrales bacterium]|nr:hypothetical protein [Candidatus Limnocylindrales bacterium]
MTAAPSRPSDRGALTVALLLGAATVASVVPNVGLLLLPVRSGLPPSDTSALQVLFDGAFLVVAPVMGFLIVRRHVRNPVGWLFIAFPALLSLGFLGDSVARHAPPSEGVAWFVLVSTSASNAAFLTLVLLLALFPNGRLISRRWRLVPTLAIVATAALLGSSVLTPALINDLDEVRNPALGHLPSGLIALGPALNGVASFGIAVALVLAIAQFVVRFRQADGVERQQLKWFGFATSIIGALLVVAAASELLLPATGGVIETIGDVSWTAAFSSFALIPIAAAIAILRYHLYDIDRIISRTVAYALVTGLLGTTFVVIVILAQATFAPVTQSNNVAVAASTLVVATLFQPVRRTVQSAVDRRFNRRRYDAERELEAFASRVRDEVEVEPVAAALATTLDRTIQPATTAVWLRRSAT